VVTVRQADDLRVPGWDPAAAAVGLLLGLVAAPSSIVAMLGALALLWWTRVRPWMLTAGAAGLLFIIVVIRGGIAAVLVATFTPHARLVTTFHLTGAIVWGWLLGTVWLGVPVGVLAASLAVVGRPASRVHPGVRAQAARERARVRQRAKRASEHPRVAAGVTRPWVRLRRAPTPAPVPPLAVVADSDLAGDWHDGHGRLQWPARCRELATVVLGVSGTGKTTLFERVAEIAAALGQPFFLLDGKGTDPDLVERIFAAYIAKQPAARVAMFPELAMDGWRGEPVEVLNRVMAVLDYGTGPEVFHADRAAEVLRLALTAPGVPRVRSSTDLLARLNEDVLTRLWAADPSTVGHIKGLYRRDDPATRVRALLASVGKSLDGAWSWENTDCAVVTVRTQGMVRDASLLLRWLSADFLHYATQRKPDDRQVLFAFDEFGAMGGARRDARDMVERVRAAGVSVLLAAQTFEGLADSDREAAQLVHGAAGGLVLFRQPDASLARLAGTVEQVEVTEQVGAGGPAGRAMLRVAQVARVDANVVRELGRGEAVVIEGNRAGLVRFIRPQVPTDARLEARELVAMARAEAAQRPPDGQAVSWTARRAQRPVGALQGPLRASLAGRSSPTWARSGGDRTPDGFLIVRPPDGRQS
jgi:hypothetical protein